MRSMKGKTPLRCLSLTGQSFTQQPLQLHPMVLSHHQQAVMPGPQHLVQVKQMRGRRVVQAAALQLW
jgi:hypothetical protein